MFRRLKRKEIPLETPSETKKEEFQSESQMFRRLKRKIRRRDSNVLDYDRDFNAVNIS